MCRCCGCDNVMVLFLDELGLWVGYLCRECGEEWHETRW
jgi:hypothetical protein